MNILNNVNASSASPHFPVSILYKSIAGRYRPVRVADGPITARYRFIKNASRVQAYNSVCNWGITNNFEIASVHSYLSSLDHITYIDIWIGLEYTFNFKKKKEKKKKKKKKKKMINDIFTRLIINKEKTNKSFSGDTADDSVTAEATNVPPTVLSRHIRQYVHVVGWLAHVTFQHNFTVFIIYEF